MTVTGERVAEGGGDPPGRMYQPRRNIFPMAVRGSFRTLKWRIMALTVTIYYVTPWIRWDRGPYAPDQAVLIDLVNRKFFFFFIEIWPQEFYYIAGLLIMAGIGLFLVTSTVGRAWCGYACPQTVWTDLFLHVERFIDGDRNAQIRLETGPWSAGKIRKRAAKHGIWLVIGLLTGGAWVFYFDDAPVLFAEIVSGQASSVAYSTIGILTTTTYVFGGLLREQVCIYMCPWPRIQAAMLDEDSLVVTYRDYRGEPRSRHRRQEGEGKQEGAGAPGDCIDCNKCVAVCPTGIDIRDGQQLACITCALCIDACDDVMARIGKPRGLIDYDTLRGYTAKKQDSKTRISRWSFIRPRTVIYSSLWSLAGLAMLVTLLARDRLELSVLRDRNPVFVRLSDGSIRNGYTVKILNMEARPRNFRLSLDGIAGAAMTVAGSTEASAKVIEVAAGADTLHQIKVYVTIDRAELAGESTNLAFDVSDLGGEETAHYDAVFRGPRE